MIKQIKTSASIAVMALALAACEQKTEKADKAGADTATQIQQATKIAQDTLITDGHIDVPYRMADGFIDVSNSTEDGDFDYNRAVSGGLNAPFMSIYTPAKLDGSAAATDHANAMIDLVEKMVAEAPDKFTIAKSVDETLAAFKEGKIALPLGMENGSPVNGSFDTLAAFYQRGIRYITLTHSKSNHISDSSYDTNRQYETGLSEFGESLIGEMNRLGIMVDISHVSDKAFYRASELSQVPLVATHSSARHFTPGFERNMDDAMIKRLAKDGGVIMINYGSSFLTEKANKFRQKMKSDYQAHLKATGLENSDAVETAFEKVWGETNPYPYADISDVLDHIDHVVKLTGSADFVGIGSDYDGVGDSLPTGLKDVSSYPALVNGLLERGYSEADIKKILSGNLIRVWQQVEAFAKASQAD